MTNENENKLNEILDNDITNEKKAIGLMLQYENAAVLAAKMLRAEHFLIEFNATIFKAVKLYIEEGKSLTEIKCAIDSITQSDWDSILANQNFTKLEWVNECKLFAITLFGDAFVAEGVFKKVQEQYLRRIMLLQYEEATSKLKCTTNFSDLQSIVNQVSNKAELTIDSIIPEIEEEDYKTMLLKALNHKEPDIIKTGYERLDEIIEGFKPGQLITVGAGTGIGKSAFAVNLALNITSLKHKVALWSFEMSKEEVVQRIFSIKTGISYRDKQKTEERYNEVRKYIDNTEDDICIFTDHITDLASFYLKCRKLSLQQKVKVVIIDYLQLVHLSGYERNRVAEIEQITNNLKRFASELKITIVILSQLSREHKKRSDSTPILSDLRDSGSIEQDSNVVIFLHKPDEQPAHYNNFEKAIELIVAKNRSGRIGTFLLKYQTNITKLIEA
jgi:replicative DNA helicase